MIDRHRRVLRYLMYFGLAVALVAIGAGVIALPLYLLLHIEITG